MVSTRGEVLCGMDGDTSRALFTNYAVTTAWDME